MQLRRFKRLARHVDVYTGEIHAFDRHQRRFALRQLHLGQRQLRRGDLQRLRLVAGGGLPVQAQLRVQLPIKRGQQKLADVCGREAERPGGQISRDRGGLVSRSAVEIELAGTGCAGRYSC